MTTATPKTSCDSIDALIAGRAEDVRYCMAEEGMTMEGAIDHLKARSTLGPVGWDRVRAAVLASA